MVTYRDIIDHCLDMKYSNAQGSVMRNIRGAVQEAYRLVSEARRWNYLIKEYRFHTNDSYSTGTIAYDHTGGANERQLTLTTGTWPTWAARGRVKIEGVIYEVDRRISDSIVTLDDVNGPAEDIAASTEYELYQDVYSLPDDFISSDQLMMDSNRGGMEYVAPAEWGYLTRFSEGPGTPRFWTVMNDPDRLTRMAMFLYPPPNSGEPVDMMYHRRSQPLLYSGHDGYDSVGTVTISGTAVTGTSTTFESGMVGSVLRVGRDSRNIPTGPEGGQPFQEECQIKTYTSATALVLESSISSNVTTRKYVVTDPVDMSPAMLSAFLRCAEWQLSIRTGDKDSSMRQQVYYMALREAKSADMASTQKKHIGQGGFYPLPLRRMPYSGYQ